MGLVGFLFGKKPNIKFTDDGRTKHEHPPKKWDDWKARFEKNPSYDWRQHTGTKAGAKESK